MSALASLLVRDQVVSVRKIEEAIQRQVVSGGALDTVLLEMAVIPENVMGAYRAATYGLLPATREEVMRVPRETIRLVPREVAERYRMVPLSAEGDTVVVAVCEPLGAEQEQQLSFLLGFEVVQRIATEVRIAAALAHHYDVEIAPRMRRVAERLRGEDAGTVPYVKPPEANRVDAARADLPRKDPISEVAPGGTRPFGTLPPAAPTENRAPAAATATPGAAPGKGVGVSRVVEIGPGVRRSSRPPPKAVAAVAPAAPRRADRPPPPAEEQATERRTAGRPITPLLRKVRGPMSAKKAVDLLEQAETRDEIIELLFFFARQFFDYTAMFVVHDDVADGREAFGPGATSEQLRLIAIPLDVPGSFGAVCKTRQPGLTRLEASDLDRMIARDLLRVDTQPALLMPITIRNRVVLLLYGDRDGEEFGLEEIPELVGIAPRIGEAFERLILRKKFQGYKPLQAPSGTAKVDLSRLTRAPRSEPPKPGAWQASPRAASRQPPAPAPVPAALEEEESTPAARTAFAPVESATPAWSPAPPVESAPEPEPARTSAPEPARTPEPEPEPTALREPQPNPTQEAEADGWAAGGEAMVPGAEDLVPGSGEPMLFSTDDELVPGENEVVPASAHPPALRVRPRTIMGLPAASTPEKGRTTSPGMAPAQDPTSLRRASWPGGERPEAFSVLGVPRTAPPPPKARAANARSAEPRSETPAAPAVEPRKGDAGTYQMSGTGQVDVIGQVGAVQQVEAPASYEEPREDSRVAKRPDPRREDDGSAPAPTEEVVHMGSDTSGLLRRQQPTARERPPLASTTPGQEPKVIVDMGDNIDALINDLLGHAPDEEGPVIEQLLDCGEAALPVLAQYFPGVLWFDRNQPHRRLPRGRDVSAIARAIVAFKDRAVPYVASLLSQDSADGRFYATLLASEFKHPDLVGPLGERVFDTDPGVRTLVLDVLRLYYRFDADYQAMLKRIRAIAKVPGRSLERRTTAIRALGQLRDAKGLDLLVGLLTESDRRVTEVAHRSLVVLTRQDFGDSHRRWTSWAERNRSRHRIEWLIDALLHADEEIRGAACDELKELTHQYYGYHPSLPKRDREVAQRKYRDWWDTEGSRLNQR